MVAVYGTPCAIPPSNTNSKSVSGHSDEDKTLCLCQESNSSHPACNLVTVLNDFCCSGIIISAYKLFKKIWRCIDLLLTMKYSLLILPVFDVLVLLEEITAFMYLFFCSSVLLIIDIIFRHGMIIIPLICALIYTARRSGVGYCKECVTQ
jgi:hypothetical protein